MPPNALQIWGLNASKRHLHDIPVPVDDYHDDDDLHDAEFNAKLFLPPKQPSTPIYGRSLWKKILHRNVDTTIKASSYSELLASLSSIIILDDEKRERDWLDRFGGRLSDVSLELLEGLRTHAPDPNKMSTVADFNDNLFYHMQQERGLRHFAGLNPEHVDELETTIKANEYLGSFLTTKSSLPQPPHVDYPWDVLEEHSQSLRIGFFPLTPDGMFLQVWPTVDKAKAVEGQIIFIPHGKLLTVPASTIHGGGFRTTCHQASTTRGNLRFHLYIATHEATLPAHQTNKYTEPADRTKELSRRYVDSKHMGVLLEHLFV